MSDLDRDMLPLDGELRDLIDADEGADVASNHERVAIRRRVLVSVGLAIGGAGGLGGIGGASAAGGGAAGAAGAGGGLGAASATVAGGFTAGKLVATSIAVTVATGGTTVAVRELRGEPPAHVSVAPVPAPSSAPITPDPVPVAPPAQAAPPSVVMPAPATPIPERIAPRTPRPAPAPPPAPPPAPVVAPAEPRVEAELVGDMSRALATGDVSRALALVAEHEQAYPDGALAEERDALRIDAFLAAGRTRDAHERASRFRARYPGSLHTARLDRALASRKVVP